jgi:ABC-type transport system involved in multi-copper enzyme maturation permease subunit
MTRVLAAEFVKLKRARMPLWTVVAVLVYALLNLAMLPAVTKPEVLSKIAQAGGAFGQAVKAGLYRPTWQNYLLGGAWGIAGSWGVLTFSLVAAYLFAHEYRERTLQNTLTLPVRREYVVLAKLVVLAAWVLGLTILSVAFQVGVVAILGASGFAWSHVFDALADSIAVSLLIYLTLPAVAWFAMLGRGYLPPMLFALAAMMLGNGIASTAASRWFPWTMGIDLVGASWMPLPQVHLVPASWAVAALFFAVGVAALVWRVDRTDAMA